MQNRQAFTVVNKYIESLSHEDLNFSKKILESLFKYEFLVKSTEQINKVRSFLEEREEPVEEEE